MIIISSTYFILFVITLVSILFNFILSKLYKDKEKVDKGFVFGYHELTHRRKMVRTLWTAPFLILCLIMIKKVSEWPSSLILLFSIFCFVTIVWDFSYNYLKWKKLEKNRGEVDAREKEKVKSI